MKILVTGGSGFVGRRFCDFYKNHEITNIDLKNGEDCRDFFKSNNEKFDLVIHLAAIVGGRETIENEPLSVATDLSIDAEMFNWAIKTNQERVVYFSSSAAYPVHLQNSEYFLKETDLNLSDIKNPDFTYGWAKMTGEYLANFARQKGVKVYVFRPFSGYGEDQDLSYPYPMNIKKALSDNNFFEIWGDGKQVRDFIYMDDIINFVNKVLELDIQDVFNIGTGEPTNFIDLANKVMKIANVKKEIIFLPNKPMGCIYRCADVSKMFKIYKPIYTLDERIEHSIEFFKNNFK
jgi:nucleoside-diphosphate-sugar epimerase